MELFTRIDDAQAIVKYPKGVHKQVPMYRRKDRVYIKHSGGYVEVRYKEFQSEVFVTGHPDIKVIEHDQVREIHTVKETGSPHMRWKESK